MTEKAEIGKLEMQTQTAATEFAPVTTVNVTILDGVVVRWFRSVAAAEYGEAVVSASRNGLTCELTSTVLPLERVDGLIETIRVAAELVPRLGRGMDCRGLATHRKEGMFGPLVPVTADA